MMARTGDPIRLSRFRRGLAPLEMVLALPILLFVMALIINYGTVASWKVRALSAARHEVWSSRWPRSSGTSPPLSYWPASAGVGAGGAGDVPELDDPRVDLPVVRGPLPNGVEVHDRLLDPTRGVRRGEADLHRDFPLLASLGAYDLKARERFLDNKWQFQRTGWNDRGQLLPQNTWRRIPVLYALQYVPAGLVSQYLTAAYAILNAPGHDRLKTLLWTEDEEVIEYHQRFPNLSVSSQGLPGALTLRHFSTLDPAVADQRVEDLIDRIQGRGSRTQPPWVRGAAWRLTRAFYGLYDAVVQEIDRLLNAVPPPPPGVVAGLQAERAQLEQKKAVLSQFLTVLEQNGG